MHTQSRLTLTLVATSAFLVPPVPAMAGSLDRASATAYAVYPEVRTLCPDGAALSVTDLEVAGLAWRTQCRVEIDTDLVQNYPFPRICSVVVHEWGHLTGLGHSTGGHMAAEAGHHPACGPSLEALERAVQRAERREIRAYDRRVRASHRLHRAKGRERQRARVRAIRARRAHATARRALAAAVSKTIPQDR